MLVPFLVILGALVLLPTVLWGFPGPWALAAIVPAFVAAATWRHLKLPRDQRAVGPEGRPGPALRPGVLVLGGLFTLVTGAAALILMWAAQAPSTVRIATEVVIAAEREAVWAVVVDLPNRKAWSPWIADAEPIGRGGATAVGSEYRATLALERYTVPAELIVTAFEPATRFAWRVKPQGGSQLADIIETVTLVREGDVLTRVHYELAYDVPTVLGRVGERIAVRGSVERLAETTADLLRQRVLMPR
jgi:carbon monoxide dehydrogenase subunit G